LNPDRSVNSRRKCTEPSCRKSKLRIVGGVLFDIVAERPKDVILGDVGYRSTESGRFQGEWDVVILHTGNLNQADLVGFSRKDSEKKLRGVDVDGPDDLLRV
jgi:hypothetical protein